VINFLVGEGSDAVQSFGDILFFAPVDIPIIFLSLEILPGLHSIEDAVGKCGFKLDFGTSLEKGY
jgi:hypothetical protein